MDHAQASQYLGQPEEIAWQNRLKQKGGQYEATCSLIAIFCILAGSILQMTDSNTYTITAASLLVELGETIA